MKAFDFKDPVFLSRSARRQKYYIEMHDKSVTREEFVAAVQSWPKKKTGYNHSRGRSAAVHEYDNLVRLYGFFPGGQK